MNRRSLILVFSADAKQIVQYLIFMQRTTSNFASASHLGTENPAPFLVQNCYDGAEKTTKKRSVFPPENADHLISYYCKIVDAVSSSRISLPVCNLSRCYRKYIQYCFGKSARTVNVYYNAEE